MTSQNEKIVADGPHDVVQPENRPPEIVIVVEKKPEKLLWDGITHTCPHSI